MKVKAHVLHHIVFALVMTIGNYSQAATGYAGGIPWQTGDIVVCFGTSGGFGGACNVLRIVNGTAILLDEFSDNLGGDTFGVAINNSLHVLATDDAGGSKVVVYSVASLNPNTSPATTLAHTPVLYPPDPNPYYDTSAAGGSMVRAVAINNAGNIFVLNSTSSTGNPNIVEIGPGPAQTPVATLSLSSCLGTQGTPLTQATSMDLSATAGANGNSLYAYVTSGGTIQQVTLSTGACTQFANFGPNVALYGVKDIPPGALANVSPNCKGTMCPTDETILVVATGVIDPGGVSVDICTDQVISPPATDSCGLLIDTNPSDQRLTAPLWGSVTLYPTLGAMILDPYADLEEVFTAGTSGATKPPFSAKGGTVIDNAVIWTNKGQPAWARNYAYTTVAPNPPTTSTYLVDPNENLQTVTGTGTSGSVEPSSPSNPTANTVSWSTTSGGMTVDGLQWNDLGQLMRVPSSPNPYSMGSLVSDPSTHAQEVIQAGESGPGALPAGGWNDSGGHTIEGVTWTESNPQWMQKTQFGVGTLIIDSNFHVQQVQQAGTSGAAPAPPWVEGGKTDDNTVTWVDLGQAVWRPSFSYGFDTIIEDAAGHVQQATTPGTSGPTQSTFVDGASPGGTVTDGLQWQNSGSQCSESCPLAWTAETQYTAGNSITDSMMYVWKASSSGTSGTAASRPAFETNEVAGTILADNAVVWTDQGTLSGSTFAWKASNAYAVNAEIIDNNRHVELVTVAGTSGFGILAPAFVDGGTVLDGTETWADLGQAVWRANFSYGLNAIIVDENGNVQQVTTAGTTGSTMPSFSSSPTMDGSVVWTNQGPLAGSAFTWQPNTTYNLNAMIVDSNNHVELATTNPQGMSGGGPNPPAFVDGGSVIDGLIWADQGTPAWMPNYPYLIAGNVPVPPPGSYILDSNNHLETVTVPGVSGPAPHPQWPLNPGVTIDGLIWADVGAWQKGTPYFTLFQPNVFVPGTAVGDSNFHVHTVVATGTSGSGAMPAGTFANPGWNDIGICSAPCTNGGLTAAGITIDNAVIWTESHPTWTANHVYTVGTPGTLILDTNNNVELVTNNQTLNLNTPENNSPIGTSGPNQPSAGGRNAWNVTTGGYTIDGLQWTTTLVSPDTTVIARYPVGVTTLQSLALDPLIVDCTAGCNYPLPPLQVSSVITSPGSTNPTSLSSPGFWLGDKQYPNFYKLDFATGTPTQFSANGPINTGGTPCSTCEPEGGIQGLGIYASEGANQPGLAKLLPPSNNLTGNSQIGYFPSSTANTTYVQNSLEQTLLNGSTVASSMGPFALYASPVAPGSCFYDSTGNPPCLATFQPGGTGTIFPIMWKSDIPLPSSGSLVVSSTQTVSENFDFPTNFQSFSNDVQLDSLLDVTTVVGLDKPGGTSKSSTLGASQLKSGNGKVEENYGCTYNSPLGASCYANPGTIPIKFSCSNLQGNSLGSYGVTKTTPWGPNIQVVEFPNAPIPPPQNFDPTSSLCNGTASTGSAPNQANAGKNASNLVPTACTAALLPSSNGATTAVLNGNHWQYNWSVQSTSNGVVYQVCTYDDSTGSWSSPTGQKGTPFCSGFFYVKNSCP
jgi:hypothetical protein